MSGKETKSNTENNKKNTKKNTKGNTSNRSTTTKKQRKSLIILSTIIKVIMIFILAGVFSLAALNIYMTLSVKGRILDTQEDYDTLPENLDCILVLGASVVNGEPSNMLADRLDKAIELYKNGVADVLVMSGDDSSSYYNEVAAMKEYAEKQGVPSDAIYSDHAGFSTYESIYRAANIYNIKSMIVVTQEYHLYRALYIAKQFDMDVYGAAPENKNYVGETQREIREILARTKDFIFCIIKPEPTYMGDQVSLR